MQSGKDVLRFDGSNDFFNISSLSGSSSNTFIGVAKRNTVPSNFCFAVVAADGGYNCFPAFGRVLVSVHSYVLCANGGSSEPNHV